MHLFMKYTYVLCNYVIMPLGFIDYFMKWELYFLSAKLIEKYGSTNFLKILLFAYTSGN